MDRLARFLAPACFSALALGCAGAATKQEATRSVALLPMANESVDVDAAAKVRRGLSAEMKAKGFTLVDIATVDAILKDRFGVTDGGQLRVVTPEKLKGVLPGDLWCFGTVKEYAFKSAGALSQRKVVLSLKAVDTATGKTLYEEEETGITTRAGIDAAGDLVLNVAGKVMRSLTPKQASAADAVVDVDLTQETREAVDKLLVKFPR